MKLPWYTVLLLSAAIAAGSTVGEGLVAAQEVAPDDGAAFVAVPAVAAPVVQDAPAAVPPVVAEPPAGPGPAPAPVTPGPSIGADPGMPSPESLAAALASPWGLALACWAFAYTLIEVLQGLSTYFASRSPAFTRSLAVLLGGAAGLVLCVTGASPLAWYIGLAWGAGGGGGPALARGIGQGMQRGSPALPQLPTWRSPQGFARLHALVMVAVMSILVAALVACGTITPAVKAGGAFVSAGYVRYVKGDTELNQAQKDERCEVACNHRKLLGLDPLPECGGVP